MTLRAWLEKRQALLEQAPDRERIAELVELALVARESGVVPTLEQLSGSIEEAAAWHRAGQIYDARRAQAIGQACEGELGRALVQADLDGGQAAAQSAAEQIAAAAAADLRGGPHASR